MRRFLVAVFIILAGMASAQEWPALHDVTGVASDDVLNVRAEPNGSAEKIGALAPNATGVEVTGTDDSGRWARLNWGERTGWVALRYLARQTNAPGMEIAGSLRCIGTEPDWSLTVEQGVSARFHGLSIAPVDSSAGRLQRAEGRTDKYLLTGTDFLTAIFSRATCSDGMSDRTYGLAVDVIVLSGRSHLYSGCCTTAGR